MRTLSLYIATSLDGFIARSDGRVDWLDAIPNPNQLDYGCGPFLASVDTTLMGNNTYQMFDQTAAETAWTLLKTESFETGFVQSTYQPLQ